ncbi:antitermination protein NusG [Pseudomonadota bacterium]
MLLKILLTAAVILGAMLILRKRVHRVQQSAAPAVSQPQSSPSRLPHYAAYGLVSIMLAGALYFVYLEWEDSYQVVTVRIIDTRSGNAVSYEAYRGDVAERSLLTLDGKMVSLAEVERMEFVRE